MPEDHAAEIKAALGVAFCTGERHVTKINVIICVRQPIHKHIVKLFPALASLGELDDISRHCCTFLPIFIVRYGKTAWK
jgi:hypothetical protein